MNENMQDIQVDDTPVWEVEIKEWRGVAAWTWNAGDDVCGICRAPFDGCAPEAKFPGDDCPVVWGMCSHAFHLQCINKCVSSCVRVLVCVAVVVVVHRVLVVRYWVEPPTDGNGTYSMCTGLMVSVPDLTYMYNVGGFQANLIIDVLSAVRSGSLRQLKQRAHRGFPEGHIGTRTCILG